MARKRYNRIGYSPLAKLRSAQKRENEINQYRQEAGIPGRGTLRGTITGRVPNVSARVSSGVFSFFRGAQQFSQKNIRSRGGFSGSSGRAGRPRGSYDSRYAAYGGVYGYRKVLAQKLRERKMQRMQASQLTPEQQQLLANARAQATAQQQNPENKTIPDTTGKVPMKSYHQEIDDAANIVP